MSETAAGLSTPRARGTGGAEQPRCLRCGFEVQPKVWGCKNPCANCGFVYPLGDCSD